MIIYISLAIFDAASIVSPIFSPRSIFSPSLGELTTARDAVTS